MKITEVIIGIILGIFIGLGIISVFADARGQEPAPADPIIVATDALCEAPAIQQWAEAAQRDLSVATALISVLVDRGECYRLPGTLQLPVDGVFAGPLTDAEGDEFYLLAVDLAGEVLYAVGWPGLTTNYGLPPSRDTDEGA